jgi:ABC-type multidrug transport system fused ATPase/permease subunit
MLKKLWSFFERSDRYRAITLLVLMIVGAGLEVLGIGLILPFIGILSNPQIIHQNDKLLWLYAFLGARSIDQFLIIASIALLVLYVSKNSYLAVLSHLQYRFIFGKQAALSSRLFQSYLEAPYSLHLQRNSSELLKNFATEISGLFTGVLTPLFLLISEGFVLVLIVALLFSLEPLVTLVTLLTTSAVMTVFYFFFRNTLKTSSRQRALHSGLRLKWVNQGLGSLKEIKILGRENFFMRAFEHSSDEYAKASRVFSTVNQLPRLFIEVVAVSGVLMVVIIILMRGMDLRQAVPLLALFAMAALRIMPSVARMFSAVASIRFYSPAVEAVHRDLQLVSDAGKEPRELSSTSRETGQIRFSHEIALREVSFSYPDSPGPAVKDVSLTIPKGSSVAFVGHSGAGKSTLVDLILGLFPPQKGRILVDGNDIQTRRESWQRCIGFVPQTIYLLDDSVRRNIAFGVEDNLIDDVKVMKAARRAQLGKLVESLPHGLDTVTGERGVRLSGGERQRIGIARALYHEPEVLVFDEATSSLDSATENEITETLNGLGREKTLIFIAHRLSTVKSCNCLFFLREGAVAASGTYDELIRNNADFRTVVGNQFTSAADVKLSIN